MRRPALRQALTLVAIALVALGLCGFGERKRLQIGDPLPTVTLSDVNGNSITLPQAIKGKVAAVRFWALDCAKCNKQLLFSLESLYQKYKDEGFLPVAIHEGRPEDCEDRLRQMKALSYPMLLDADRTAAIDFGLVGLPTTYIVDENGIVREKIIGETEAEHFEKLLTTVLYKGGFYDSAH
jgi:peroxiredoxin